MLGTPRYEQVRVRYLDAFYSPVPALVLSAALLVALVLACRWRKGSQLAIAICVFLFARYMVWRALYTLNLDDVLSTAISSTLFLAETYGFLQFLLFSFQAWSPTERKSPDIRRFPSVDIMVTVVDEPLYILRRTLVGCVNQDYPKDRLVIHLLDDGRRPELRALADALGVTYVSRGDRTHAKAGNLNHALRHTSGEVICVFDVDHVPSPDFLQRTIGFFEDEKVAIVQTAQGFYNQDIFQRSVGPTRGLHNEQALFFRVLQAGRDRHNSAFFAGSSGLLRRKALEEIGGFQTETITEDLHTSLRLHARGWQSVYLNETLAFGLMPESYEGHYKQRSRWATGTSQVFKRDNPLLVPGLSWAQRLDYLGSMHYFLFGLPRIVFLAAPLTWLLLGIPALRSDISSLLNFYFTTYLASVLTIGTISRNTRNAFWSDIHDTVLCFSMVRATLIGLLPTRTPREFVVTPKGGRTMPRSLTDPSALGWHAALAILLALGIANGVQQAFSSQLAPSLAISIGWASFNLVLLSVAMIAAREHRQLRGFVRRECRLPCWVIDAGEQNSAVVIDVNESGAALRLHTLRYSLSKQLQIAFETDAGDFLSVNATVVRQEMERDGGAILGIAFEDSDQRTIDALIACSFSSAALLESRSSHSGVVASFVTLLATFARVRKRLHPSGRRSVRIPLAKTCRLLSGGTLLAGITRDISFVGVSAAFPGAHTLPPQLHLLSIEDVELVVSFVGAEQDGGETLARFRVETVAKGAPTWRSWHQPSSH